MKIYKKISEEKKKNEEQKKLKKSEGRVTINVGNVIP